MESTWREYYIKIWNFDPEQEIIWIEQKFNHFRYEKQFSIIKDSYLHEANIKIVARVECKNGNINNFLIFQRDRKEIPVKVVHTVIFRGTIEEIQTIGEDHLKKLLPSRGQKLAILSPEEHFVALQSFVKMLINTTFLTQIRLLLSREQHIPLGRKILDALYKIAPNEIQKMINNIEHEAEIEKSRSIYGIETAELLFIKLVNQKI